MAGGEKDLQEMSAAELREYLHEKSGLRVPAETASAEVWRQWFVSLIFIAHHKTWPDDPPKAKRLAAAECRRSGPGGEYEPYILQALGQKDAA
jgi:hypothetical protein